MTNQLSKETLSIDMGETSTDDTWKKMTDRAIYMWGQRFSAMNEQELRHDACNCNRDDCEDCSYDY